MGRGAQSSGSPGGAQGARRRAPMPDNLEQAAEFHRQFKVDVQEAPCIPAESRTKLRLNLLQEELDELREAVATGNVVEVADALADIQYVLSGTVLEFGMQNCFKELVDEVHRSNMSKAATTEEEARRTVEHYATNKNTEAYTERQEDGTYNIYRRSDNKTLKSVEYSPPDCAGILRKHTPGS